MATIFGLQAKAQLINQQTVMVTNWIQPSENYSFIGKQLYDKQHQPFITVMIPAAASIGVDYTGPVDYTSHPQTLSASWREYNTDMDVTIKNFPFVRGMWTFQNGRYFLQGSGGPFAQAVLVSDTPRYDKSGALVGHNTIYDCGMPMTAPYMVVQAYKPLTEEQKKQLAERQAEAAKKQAEAATKAFEFLKSDADSGNATAQYNLSKCYMEGKGCEVDTNEAMRWLRLSASGGNVAAVKRMAELKK